MSHSNIHYLFDQLRSFDQLVELSFDANGYVRERAVRRLGQLADARAMQALIVRVNDWVPQVRRAAHEALTNLLVPANAAAVARHLPSLMALSARTRADHSRLIARAVELLAHPEHRSILVECIRNGDRDAARVAFTILIERRLESVSEIARQGLSHRDVTIRMKAVGLLRELSDTDFPASCSTAIRDPLMEVRREALQQLLRRDSKSGLTAARAALFDPAIGMRQVALKALLAEQIDVVAIYERAYTANERSSRIAKCVLWAWAELGEMHRLPQIRLLLCDPSPGIRLAALSSLAKLEGASAAPAFRAALADESPAVCKFAAQCIVRYEVAVELDRLIDLAQVNPDHVAVACLTIARHRGKWDWLEFLLAVLPRRGNAIARTTLVEHLIAWDHQFNRHTEVPSVRQCTDLGVSFGSIQLLLPEKLERELSFALRLSGIHLR